jgi:hypothetical protein
MPLLPIDLQTVFSQANQVGREQALQQQASPEAQAQAASALVREAEARDTQVNQSQDAGDGVEAAKDQEGGGSGTRKRRGREQHKPDRESRPVFTDPDLGRHVDITG